MEKTLQINDHRQIVLAGQPNCGKSTLFNEVAGYQSYASNFPGATVEYTRSHVNICGQTFDIVDLPGIYSLTSLDQAAKESQRYLMTQSVDVIINVVDASILSRHLELTLQLMDLEIPMILCLNMMDEARRKGLHIDIDHLSNILGMPVIPTVAAKGKGVKALFQQALHLTEKPKKASHLRGNRDVEQVIESLIRHLKTKFIAGTSPSPHLFATKLLENDPYFKEQIRETYPEVLDKVRKCQKKLSVSHGKSADEVINGERHMLAMSIFERSTVVSKPVIQFKDRVDQILMHPVWGYVFLMLFLFIFFQIIFKIGSFLENPLLNGYDQLSSRLLVWIPQGSFFYILIKSMVDGLGGGLGIVLPYLLPFLIGLTVLEDIGYLPRVAFLMDAFMHRIGLHGTAVIPAVLGYGCNVPAVMATRILESSRDRFIAAFIATLVPCAARMTIIFGLVGAYLGGAYAFGIYLLNLVVIVISGSVLSRLMPEDTPGMMLEIPVYHRPQFKVVCSKTWFRIKEFVIIAWPLLILGSAVLTMIEHFNWLDAINHGLRPITSLLGLPKAVGTTLIFGVLRKELSMLMLFQAVGTRDLLSVMTLGQILVFTVFVVFYVPCLGTIGVLGKQVKARRTLLIVVVTFFIALMLGMITRGFAALFF
ncbi:ferrous iron transport protein B [bacterium]|nr:ferrous iron transport protein B [bacterium]